MLIPLSIKPLVIARFISWDDLHGSDYPPQASLKEYLILLLIIAGVFAVSYLNIKLDERYGASHKVLHWILQPLIWVLAFAMMFVYPSLLSQWLTYVIGGAIFIIASLIVWLRDKYNLDGDNKADHENVSIISQQETQTAIIPTNIESNYIQLTTVSIYDLPPDVINKGYEILYKDDYVMLRDLGVSFESFNIRVLEKSDLIYLRDGVLSLDQDSGKYKIDKKHTISRGKYGFMFSFWDFLDRTVQWYYFDIEDPDLKTAVMESI